MVFRYNCSHFVSGSIVVIWSGKLPKRLLAMVLSISAQMDFQPATSANCMTQSVKGDNQLQAFIFNSRLGPMLIMETPNSPRLMSFLARNLTKFLHSRLILRSFLALRIIGCTDFYLFIVTPTWYQANGIYGSCFASSIRSYTGSSSRWSAALVWRIWSQRWP